MKVKECILNSIVIIAILIILRNIAVVLKTDDSEKLLINFCFLMGGIYIAALRSLLSRLDRINESYRNDISKSEIHIWIFSFKILGIAFMLMWIAFLLLVLGKAFLYS